MCRRALLAAALALAACSKPASRDLQAGSYRATLELPGDKTVPFGLDVAQEEPGKVLYVTNGDERIRLDEVTVNPGQLQARFPGYETMLVAQVTGDELTGDVTLVHEAARCCNCRSPRSSGPPGASTPNLCRTTRTSPDGGTWHSRTAPGGVRPASPCSTRDSTRDGHGADAHR